MTPQERNTNLRNEPTVTATGFVVTVLKLKTKKFILGHLPVV